MMKTRPFFSLVLIAFIGLMGSLPKLHAQEGLSEIRQHYYAVKQRITELEQAGVPAYYQMNVVRNLPATGMQHMTVNMYYDSRDDHSIWPSHWLELATASYNYAVRQFYEEYLFLPNGDLSFIFVRTPDVEFGKEYEFRFYFDDGLIHVSVRSRSVGEGEFVEEFADSEVPTSYLSFYHEYLRTAQNYRHLFNTIETTVKN